MKIQLELCLGCPRFSWTVLLFCFAQPHAKVPPKEFKASSVYRKVSINPTSSRHVKQADHSVLIQSFKPYMYKAESKMQIELKFSPLSHWGSYIMKDTVEEHFMPTPAAGKDMGAASRASLGHMQPLLDAAGPPREVVTCRSCSEGLAPQKPRNSRPPASFINGFVYE